MRHLVKSVSLPVTESFRRNRNLLCRTRTPVWSVMMCPRETVPSTISVFYVATYFFGASVGGTGACAGGSGLTGVMGVGFKPRSSWPVTKGVIAGGFIPSSTRIRFIPFSSLIISSGTLPDTAGRVSGWESGEPGSLAAA